MQASLATHTNQQPDEPNHPAADSSVNQSPGADHAPRILIISPVKDEGEYIERTLKSMVAQTLKPSLWLIVDDGSSDETAAIAERYAAQHPWIRVFRRPQGRARRVGPGVIEAFYAGLETTNLNDYDYVCKLDGDLEFGPNYFRDVVDLMQADPRLGTLSGKTHIPVGDRFVLERTGDEFSHGVAKLYKRECFEQIGGFVHQVMWDGIDCHRCRMLGWKAASTPDPRLAIRHLRLMGSSHKSVYHGRRRWGFGQYFMGTHPLYMLGISAYRMAERPWILGGLNILVGYIGAWLKRTPQYDDPEFRRFLHAWQMNELKRRFGLGKRAR